MFRHWIAVGIVAFGIGLLFGCKGGALKLTFDGSEKAFEPSAGVLFASTKTFSEPDGKGGFKQGKASAHSLFLTNFKPKADVMNLQEKTAPTAADNVRVSVSLIGKDGTEAGGAGPKAPLAPGTYDAKQGKFDTAESISITVFADGKAKEISFDASKTEGSVKITKADAESVSGELDLHDGKSTIAGSFTVKLEKL